MKRVRECIGLGLILGALLCGCATRPGPLLQATRPLAGAQEDAVAARARETLSRSFPPCSRSVHRAILTVGRKQFTCDGVLKVSADGTCHLAVVSALGLVSEVEVNQKGDVKVLKVTPLFRESWTRQYLARDLRWLFLPPADLTARGRMPDGGLVLETGPDVEGLTGHYLFTADGERWEKLELSRQGRRVYHVSVRRYRAFPGHPAALPAEFEVDAGAYRLSLRIVELAVCDTARPGRTAFGLNDRASATVRSGWGESR
jgi:hypothetical protein